MLGWARPSAAAVQVRAQVASDLRTITGELVDPEDHELGDALAALPMPEDDLVLLRTFPGAPNEGSLQVDGERFEARLPRRYGALGSVAGRGLWANGGWHPVPLDEGALPVLDWVVEVELPEGSVGVLNGVVGEGTLRWEGSATRLSLAVVEGRLTELDEGLWLVDTGPRRPRRDRELVAMWRGAFPPGTRPERLVVVEAPLQRRLVRPGEGLLYLSDLAFRTPSWLYRFHRGAVGRGLLGAGLELEDPWARELAAATLGSAWAESVEDVELSAVMRLGSFVPLVDYLLYSGRMPFHSEVFDETFLDDPLQDDLLEMFGPRISGRVLATKLDDSFGFGTSDDLAGRLLAGQDLLEAAAAVGVSPEFVESWRRPYPEQDLKLEVSRGDGDWRVQVRRLAPEDAPEETVLVEIDGGLRAWEAPAGSGDKTWELGARPRRVALDPQGHLRQTAYVHDRWPTRWTAVGTLYPEVINVSQMLVVGVAVAQLRRQYDTRNVYTVSAFADEQNLLAARLGWSRYHGPLVDRRLRQQRLSLWASGGLLSPGFASTADGRYALELGLGYRWDTRALRRFPLKGHAVYAGGDLGVVPESGLTWGSVGVGGVKILGAHPKAVFALRGDGDLASGRVSHRLLPLGGSSAMRSLPASAVVGQQRALVGAELRLVPFRDLSLPLLWLYWLDEVQLTGGLEAGVLSGGTRLSEAGEHVDPSLGQSFTLVGSTASLLLVSDGLGVVPWTFGATAARPVWTSTELDQGWQLYLRFGQEF